MESILLVEDRDGLREVYATFLRKQEYLVKDVPSAEAARVALDKHDYALILTDYMLPGQDGLGLLKTLKQKDPDTLVIVMTAFGEIRTAVEAIKAGAFDFLEKPVDLDYLKHVIQRALAHRSLVRRRSFTRARGEADREAIVGGSEALAAALELADKVAATDTTCMILGESGVGKELFARRIHARSSRTEAEMVSINCASIPRDLVESELFGHEKGAFTGAVARKIGLVEMADGGTLFLDEIGELSLELQPKLLRVIQTREFFRVGGNRTCRSDIRLVCATNRNLRNGVRDGWFREDLFYRLNTFPIEIPPLRERPEDLAALIPWLLEKSGHPHPNISAPLLRQLRGYPWPGNVRELENVLERAVILSGGNPLTADHFPADLFRQGEHLNLSVDWDLNQSLKQNLADIEPQLERRIIGLLLKTHAGHRARVAGQLGISVKTLYNKIKAHGLE